MSTLTVEHNSYLIENWDTETLVNFLKKQNLKLDDDDLKILRKDSPSFLDMIKEKFMQAGLKMELTMKLAKEVQVFKEKLKRIFFLYLSLSEVLVKYDLDFDGIDSILLFFPSTYEIQDDNKVFKRCMEEILDKKTLEVNSKSYQSLCDSVKEVLGIIVSLLMNSACAEKEPERKRTENIKHEAENAKLKSKVEELEVRLVILEQSLLIVDEQPQNEKEMSSEDMEMDAFLVEVHKKSISNEIIKRNKKKKLNKAVEDQEKVSIFTLFLNFSEILLISDKKNIIYLYQRVSNAESLTMKTNQEEILSWYLYTEEFLIMVKDIMANGKVSEKKTKGQNTPYETRIEKENKTSLSVVTLLSQAKADMYFDEKEEKSNKSNINSDTNKSNSDVYFKFDNSDNEYDHKLHKIF
ncbi:hypothetical protein GLOIN_2v1522857 [Rhizophagus clarus]|uniref:Uncharacterized protein n=1 Tax=Rhizophagus clarus TaxID=94130 RepID=A0A8H3QUA3_9GLOM|nr:hypothetical protein GLOIN_2v1522857 [Rhizophagus clarus]